MLQWGESTKEQDASISFVLSDLLNITWNQNANIPKKHVKKRRKSGVNVIARGCEILWAAKPNLATIEGHWEG